MVYEMRSGSLTISGGSIIAAGGRFSEKTLVRTGDSSWGQFAVANPNDAEVGIVWAAAGSGYPGIDTTYTRQWIAGLSPFGTGMDRWSLTNRTLGASTAITVLDTGSVGFGTTSPSTRVQVNGTITATGGVINGVLTINRNATGLVINRDAVTNYNGIYYSTAGSPRWFIGLRENLSSNNYICYSEQTAVDVMTLNLADNSASFAAGLFNNGLFRTAGSSNVIWWSGATQTASFGAILGDSTTSRTAFFRSSSTSGGASVWWGGIDTSGRNIPYAAIDATSGGGLSFWNNTGGSGGGDWTNIFSYNANGVGINTTPSATYKLNVSGSVQATSFFESSDMRFKTNINDYDSDDILNISAKIYEKDGKLEVGYLAQDLQSVLKCSVSTREDGYLDLSYRQVHTAKISMLEKRISELEEQLKQK